MATSGASNAKHNPFAVLNPIRNPVNEPGPIETAIAPSCPGVIPPLERRASTCDNSFSECTRSSVIRSSIRGFPDCASPTEQTLVDDSMPRTTMVKCLWSCFLADSFPPVQLRSAARSHLHQTELSHRSGGTAAVVQAAPPTP